MKEEIEEKHIIMTDQDRNLFGLMVDEVTDVLRIPEAEFNTTPEFVSRIDRTYISGVLTRENRLIIMLDLKKVMSEEELAKLSDIRLSLPAAMEEAEETQEIQEKLVEVQAGHSPVTSKPTKKKNRRNIND